MLLNGLGLLLEPPSEKIDVADCILSLFVVNEPLSNTVEDMSDTLFIVIVDRK